MEDQVTYPIVSALLGVPKVKDIRGFSDFGFSYVYIIFEDGTDIYWARSRTLEYLSNILPRLPQGVNVELARDETAIGWVFQYALVDKTGKNDLSQLRSFQDWYLRYALAGGAGSGRGRTHRRLCQAVSGQRRSEQAGRPTTSPLIASSRRYGQGTMMSAEGWLSFQGSNIWFVGIGYIKNVSDVENIVVGTSRTGGTPILVKDLGMVTLGPDIRRGVADLNGEGEVVGGIVIMRFGENALKVIERVRAKLEDMKPSLPPGVEIVTTYDRGDLDRACDRDAQRYAD